MNIISVENISKSYSEKALIENISLGINEGEKIGLIGVNGTGKSTLLKIIAGVEVADAGNIIKANRARIEYLSQNPAYDDEATIIQQVFNGNSQELRLLREYEEILYKVQGQLPEEEYNLYNGRLLKLQSSIDNMNLWDLESEAKTILTKLGVEDYNAIMGELSGGQRKRVALASALITPCDLLILDEPTNHMDNETIDWLEKYLKGRKGALLMVTHDRYFLDRIANRIIELDRGNLYSYEGNYSIFIEKKLEREALEAASEDKRQNLLRKELAWVRRGAKARSTKQKARLQRFDELNSKEGIQKSQAADISSVSSRLGRKVIEIKNLSKSIEDKTLIKDFTYTLLRDDRIGIVGPNGIGKSTLMRLIYGEIKPDAGSIEIGETVNIGFFSQENQHMDDDMRVIEYVREEAEFIPTADGEKISASQMCERFLFDATMQWTPIGKLSGGEKRRLYLLRVLMKAPNVLLLDEPSNDLDIETLKVLEDYLDNFKGAVITVSHDRYFIDRICSKIFFYEGAGRIKQYNGNYEDFIEAREEEVNSVTNSKNTVDKKISSVDKSEEKKKKPLKFTFKEQMEFEEIDGIIEEIEKQMENLEKSIEASASDYEKLQKLLEEKEALQIKLEEKYERWEYLNELAAKIEASKI